MGCTMSMGGSATWRACMTATIPRLVVRRTRQALSVAVLATGRTHAPCLLRQPPLHPLARFLRRARCRRLAHCCLLALLGRMLPSWKQPPWLQQRLQQPRLMPAGSQSSCIRRCHPLR